MTGTFITSLGAERNFNLATAPVALPVCENVAEMRNTCARFPLRRAGRWDDENLLLADHLGTKRMTRKNGTA